MATNSLQVVKNTIFSPAVQEQIQVRLGERSGAFTSSVLDLMGANNRLMECNPMEVIREAMKAASLNLPISNQLGFAYVIPYKMKGRMTPSFQMGYKGYIQLALRTGQYHYLNAGKIYEGETWEENRIAGTFEITGDKTSEHAIGFFCYFKLISGFEKGIAWTREQVVDHAKKYSKEYQRSKGKYGVWKDNFEAMALKTMVMALIPTYGPLTVDMAKAQQYDVAQLPAIEDNNSDALAITEGESCEENEDTKVEAEEEIPVQGLTEEEKQEILEAEKKLAENNDKEAPF